jgi:hypothetical protein
MNDDLQKQLQQQFVALAHKHAHVSYALLGVLVLVLGLMLAGGIFAVKFADRVLDKADAANAQYAIERKADQQKIAELAKQIADQSSQQKVLVQVVHDRDQKTNEKIKDVYDAKTAEQTAQAFRDAYQQPIAYDAYGVFQLEDQVVKEVTVTRIDRDRLKADLDDTKKNLGLETDKFDKSQTALSTAQGQLKQCEDVKNKYEKAAHVGKFKKFLHGAGSVAAPIAALILGYKLGHR